MAIMEGSTSPASRSPSPASSESFSRRPRRPEGHGGAFVPTARPSSPEAKPRPESTTLAICEWNDCKQRFTDMQGLVGHLHSDHIGGHKSSYICEWSSCSRRGLVQTSRFALVSHCRSHTGEKPFICTIPECDKSFTRSDTLAKHLRQQHNVEPPASTRGGYRKRKRSMTPPRAAPPPSVPDRRASSPPIPHPDAPSHYNFANRTYANFQDARDSGFNTFRVNPTIHDRPAVSASSTLKFLPDVEGPPQEAYPRYADGRREESPSCSEGDEVGGKPYNAEAMGGRSKAMVKYMIMKAKYRYVMAEKGLLSDELEALKQQEREEWREKEAGVDRVLRVFGPESDQLIHEPEGPPTNGKRGPPSVSPREDGHPPPHISRHDHRMEVDAR